MTELEALNSIAYSLGILTATLSCFAVFFPIVMMITRK